MAFLNNLIESTTYPIAGKDVVDADDIVQVGGGWQQVPQVWVGRPQSDVGLPVRRDLTSAIQKMIENRIQEVLEPNILEPEEQQIDPLEKPTGEDARLAWDAAVEAGFLDEAEVEELRTRLRDVLQSAGTNKVGSNFVAMLSSFLSLCHAYPEMTEGDTAELIYLCANHRLIAHESVIVRNFRKLTWN